MTFYSSESGKINRDLTSWYTAMICKDYVRNKDVLQMGLGDGYLAEALAPQASYFCVVEGSSEVIRDANSAQFEILTSYFETFVPRRKFEVVLANHVLEHVADPVAVLMRMKEWLVDDGIAVLTVPNATSLHRRIGVKMGLLGTLNALHSQDLELGHKRVYDKESFVADVQRGGFEVLKLSGYLLKVVSQRQMRDWPRALLDASFDLSLELAPELCANLIAVCSPG